MKRDNKIIQCEFVINMNTDDSIFKRLANAANNGGKCVRLNLDATALITEISSYDCGDIIKVKAFAEAVEPVINIEEA